MKNYPIIDRMPHLRPLLDDADHIDIKLVEGDMSLQQFIAAMLSYYPSWMKHLYRIRWVFVRLLGMKQTGVPQSEQMQLRPEDVPMQLGEKMTFFTVEKVSEPDYWFASATEAHLTAKLGVIREPQAQGYRFHVVTIVQYHNWAGPVYFNVIRPFHHLVVGVMARSAVKGQSPQTLVANGA